MTSVIREMLARALERHQAGDLRLAERTYRQVLQADPTCADAWCFLGAACDAAGNPTEAETSYRRAIRLKPDYAAAHHNLGLALEHAGKLAEAVGSYRQALKLQPGNIDTRINLGNALRSQGKLDDAIACYRQVLQLRPDQAEVHVNLGNTLAQQEKPDQAAASWQQALHLRPDFPEPLANLGNFWLSRDNLSQAESCYREALRIDARHAAASNGLGQVFERQDKLDEAVECYQHAIQSQPAFAEAHNNLGNALVRQQKLTEAVTAYRTALTIKPNFAEALYNLGLAYEQQDKFEDAIPCFHQALGFDPQLAEARNNLGCIQLRQGRQDLALVSFRQALELQPNLLSAHSNLVGRLNYDPDADPDAVFREHCRWGQLHQPSTPPLPHSNDRTPDRRLRIGYVSGDFCFHALTRYLEPVLTNHNPAEVQVFCYAEVAAPDAVTKRLQALAHGWHWTCRKSDAGVVERIRSDRIDVLVDLAGHTTNNRLGVFRLKPAPIQATWLGYMNTTGVPAIDYRLTDEVLDPPGQPVRDTEELIRLPTGFCCFMPPWDAPPVSKLPAVAQGRLTFGVLQGMMKINVQVLDLWCRTLKAVPGSRLLMFHHTLTPDAQAIIRHRFAENAIDPERLELRLGHCDPGYLSVYNEIDISLDTTPCTGGVTTCEGLWMGVPVLTLAGVRPASRNSAALLARVGLSDWVANSPENYVDLATRWAADLPRLADLRAGMRERMAATLCDAGTFTKSLEAAYRAMWHRWLVASRFQRDVPSKP